MKLHVPSLKKLSHKNKDTAKFLRDLSNVGSDWLTLGDRVLYQAHVTQKAGAPLKIKKISHDWFLLHVLIETSGNQ